MGHRIHEANNPVLVHLTDIIRDNRADFQRDNSKENLRFSLCLFPLTDFRTDFVTYNCDELSVRPLTAPIMDKKKKLVY